MGEIGAGDQYSFPAFQSLDQGLGKVPCLREVLRADENGHQGEILQGLIAEERVKRETRLFYGLNEGCRLTSDDYVSVMTKMRFPETLAKNLYSELIDASRYIAKKRDEERSILLESTL